MTTQGSALEIMPDTLESQLEAAHQERDLYLRLLELGGQSALEPFLEQALGLIVEVTGARQGYLELRDHRADGDHSWWMAHGFSDEEIQGIRSQISHGIVAEALATGRTIDTPSALLDDRFSERRSVQLRQIEAVLCAPVGEDAARGVVYLQGPGPFLDRDRGRVELFARHLSPITDRLLDQRRAAESVDASAALRAQYRLESIIGRSPALAAALQQAMLAAPLDVSVLLTGASGTGKSQLARVIHENSPRASGPFVALNCAALPENLVESELFGALAGSHSEAKRDIAGKVAAAEGGTFLLDEIGDLPIGSQAKLLQLLQSHEYYPLGATEPVQADIRLIAATNSDLSVAVAERRMREDLFYRLQVLPVRMPSLAERRADIPELAAALCTRIAERHRIPACELSPGARRAIESAEWPGNIRQLEHSLEAACIRTATEGVNKMEARHIFPAEHISQATSEGTPSFQEATRDFQRGLLEETLLATEWNVSEAARRLDLARSHVYNLIHSFGLARRGNGEEPEPRI